MLSPSEAEMEQMYDYYQKRTAYLYNNGKVKRPICFTCAMSAIDSGVKPHHIKTISRKYLGDCHLCGTQLNWIEGEY